MKIIKNRDANKRLNVEISDVDANCYNTLVQKIVEFFHLKTQDKLTIGLDEIFQDYFYKNYIIGLEWDIWSGFVIVSKNKNSEEFVNQIYDWLCLKDNSKCK